MNVCDNLGDHLMGNVYIKFVKEQSTGPCVQALNNRWYVNCSAHMVGRFQVAL